LKKQDIKYKGIIHSILNKLNTVPFTIYIINYNVDYINNQLYTSMYTITIIVRICIKKRWVSQDVPLATQSGHDSSLLSLSFFYFQLLFIFRLFSLDFMI